MASSTSSPSNKLFDVDEKTLKTILNKFGSTFPLEDIASAFCEAGQNAELTGQILLARNNVGELYTNQEEISEITSESSNSIGNLEPPYRNGDANFGASKLQRDSLRGFSNGATPVKSEKRWVVKHPANSSRPDTVASQIDEYEDFLFKILQHGFRVDRDVIRRVLGECGCDMKKSLEKLSDLAAEKHYSKYEQIEGKVSDKYHRVEAQRTSLLPRVGNQESEIEEQDNDYYILHKAVKEYRSTMNEYYRTATEAYAIGDHARSIMLLEKGEFFYRKAREADEQLAKRIYSSSIDEEEVIPINLEKCMPKEAVRLLKSHLRNFSGIASVYLRVINGDEEEDASRRASRIRLTQKLQPREQDSSSAHMKQGRDGLRQNDP
ncbi:hypothetical protein V2J09_004154 [Rumex salicifolius]